MYHGTRPGWIEGKRVQLFKSHLDSRYGGVQRISTHDGVQVDAVPVDSSLEIMARVKPDTEVVAIDEIQFLDEGIVAVAGALADRGVRVVLAGLETDFRGEPFGAMPQLLAVAEIVDKLHAICVVCGDPACRNQRLVNGRPALYDSPTILVGGSESYEARCRHCHRVPRVDEDQGRLFAESARRQDAS
jgi:thymidine kinase